MKLIQSIEDCCPVVEAPLDRRRAEKLAAAFKVLADPARLRLLSIIGAKGEACVCDLTAPLGLTQPTVSHHLKVLHDAGFLSRQKRGIWAYYAVTPGARATLTGVLSPAGRD